MVKKLILYSFTTERFYFGDIYLINVILNIDSLLVYWYKYHLKKQPLLPNLNQGGWSYLKDNEKRFTMFEVVSQTEQAPNPDNRVMLSSKLDRLGCPKAQLNWHWTETDITSIRRSHYTLC